MDKPQWYVLKVVSGQEKKVKSYLEAELARQQLSSYVTQILIPVEQVYEMRGGKRKTKERNFFPGYVLICAELLDGRVRHIIKNIPGALGFLSVRGWGASKEPVPLRQAEINRILGKLDEGDVGDLPLEASFTVGEMVKVIDGPFNGFSGSVQEVFEERKKLNIAVKIFERNTPIELNYVQVEKLA
ncbi:MAG: transcription termination/antitermination protein NusG [Bacteroidota bacterium]